eukprot:7980534-Lingulodinium_polyedra.AAC.1
MCPWRSSFGFSRGACMFERTLCAPQTNRFGNTHCGTTAYTAALNLPPANVQSRRPYALRQRSSSADP